MRFHFSELFDQHLLTDVGNETTEIGQSARRTKEMIENNSLPTPGNDFEGPFDGKARKMFQRVGQATLRRG